MRVIMSSAYLMTNVLAPSFSWMSRVRRIRGSNVRCAFVHGSPGVLPACSASSLGRVPEQILQGRWVRAHMVQRAGHQHQVISISHGSHYTHWSWSCLEIFPSWALACLSLTAPVHSSRPLPFFLGVSNPFRYKFSPYSIAKIIKEAPLL